MIKNNGCFKIINGREMCCVGSEEFVRYLNMTYKGIESEDAKILIEHSRYNPKLPKVDI